MDDFRAGSLQDASHDVDRGVVSIEQRARRDDSDLMLRGVNGSSRRVFGAAHGLDSTAPRRRIGYSSIVLTARSALPRCALRTGWATRVEDDSPFTILLPLPDGDELPPLSGFTPVRGLDCQGEGTLGDPQPAAGLNHNRLGVPLHLRPSHRNPCTPSSRSSTGRGSWASRSAPPRQP